MTQTSAQSYHAKKFFFLWENRFKFCTDKWKIVHSTAITIYYYFIIFLHYNCIFISNNKYIRYNISTQVHIYIRIPNVLLVFFILYEICKCSTSACVCIKFDQRCSLLKFQSIFGGQYAFSQVCWLYKKMMNSVLNYYG